MLFWGNNKNRNRSSSNSSKNSSNSSNGRPASQVILSNSLDISKSSITKPISQINPSNTHQLDKQMHKKYNISKQQLNNLVKIFNTYDEDEDGILSINELDNFLADGKQQVSLTSIKKMFPIQKNSTTAGLSLQKFVSLLSKTDNQVLDNQRDLRNAFRGFDKKNRGYFDFEDYLVVSKTIKQQFDIAQLRQAFDYMDQDRNGFINYQEFKQMAAGQNQGK